jgi:hypothetical protein
LTTSAAAVEGVSGTSDVGIVGVATEQANASIAPAGILASGTCLLEIYATGTASVTPSGTAGYAAVGMLVPQCNASCTFAGTQGHLDLGIAIPAFALPSTLGVSATGQVIADMVVLNPWIVWFGSTV